MNIKSTLCLSLAAAALLLSGCASVRTAQPKSVDLNGTQLNFGGSYDQRANELTLTVNGDPLARGKFPPYTPTQRLNGNYKGIAINASCYFGSVLGRQGGVVGIVGSAVQGNLGKGGDTCQIIISEKVVETLYF